MEKKESSHKISVWKQRYCLDCGQMRRRLLLCAKLENKNLENDVPTKIVGEDNV